MEQNKKKEAKCVDLTKELEKKSKCCELSECRHWISFPDDYNCSLIAIEKEGNMTLHEVAKRLGISHVRVNQIQDKALSKMLKKVNNL